jgi:hypothetical protein
MYNKKNSNNRDKDIETESLNVGNGEKKGLLQTPLDGQTKLNGMVRALNKRRLTTNMTFLAFYRQQHS